MVILMDSEYLYIRMFLRDVCIESHVRNVEVL